MAARTVIIGVGNAHRGDDGIGLIVARGLRGRIPEEIRIVEETGDGAAILEALAGVHRAILVDAAQSAAAPGTIHRFDASATGIPADFLRLSSHSFGAAAAIEMARALGQLPARTIVYGIAGANFGNDEELHPAVQQAAIALIAQIGDELQAP
ncbi:MAG TPA: hydrogenase maturation protease [Candidatus Acidoferrales bacterium]|nr:hydrogenase maturation protease [Candidatus Acidoferrales bacterium]